MQTIELRDVLNIQQLQLNMSVAGQVLARFQKQDEGLLMIEELVAPESEEEFVFPEEDEMQEIVRPFNVKEMNIKLTFVLGHSDITVDELSKMEPGYIYSIGENKEREVKVYANKQLIAEGELIYIGNSDELGLKSHMLSVWVIKEFNMPTIPDGIPLLAIIAFSTLLPFVIAAGTCYLKISIVLIMVRNDGRSTSSFYHGIKWYCIVTFYFRYDASLQDVNNHMRQEQVDFSNAESIDSFVENGLGDIKRI